MNNLELIIFDLDGTLIDSERDLANSVNYCLRHFDIPELSLEEVKSNVGHGVRFLMEQCLPEEHRDLTDEALALFKEHYFENCSTNTLIYDGVIEFLEKHKSKKMAVLTNKIYRPTKKILVDLKLDQYFKVVVGGDTFQTKKPDTEGIDFILSELGVAKENAIMIGDGVPDIQVAKNAGVPVVAILGGITSSEKLTVENPDFTVKSFRDLFDHTIFKVS